MPSDVTFAKAVFAQVDSEDRAARAREKARRATYEPPKIHDISCVTCRLLLRQVANAIADFNDFTQPKLAGYADLSFEQVNELKRTIVDHGARVRRAHEAFRKHSEKCRGVK